MNVLIPADRIFEPLLAGVPKRGLDLRADVGLADAAIEIGHEDDGRNLLQQRAILGLEIRSVCVSGQCGAVQRQRLKSCRRAAEHAGQLQQECFSFAQLRQRRKIVELRLAQRLAHFPFGLCRECHRSLHPVPHPSGSFTWMSVCVAAYTPAAAASWAPCSATPG